MAEGSRYLVGYLYKDSGGRHFGSLVEAITHVEERQEEEPLTPLAIWDGHKIITLAWEGIFFHRDDD